MLADPGLDELIQEAGRTHVVPPREDPVLLDRVRDPRVLSRSRELLRSNDKEWRNRAILCIERIAYAQHDQESAEFLLQHAMSAKDKDEVRTALEALKRCTPPKPLPAEPLVRLARRREWQVWHPAVECLHLASAREVEPALLERLDADPDGVVYVARELRYMRSARSIQALERLLEHKTVDVRCVALDSLGERLGPKVVRFARGLARRTAQEQNWAEKWISRFGDVSDVPFMAKRAKALINRKQPYEPPELSYLIPFLSRHSGLSESQAALDFVHRTAERLPESERHWLRMHTESGD